MTALNWPAIAARFHIVAASDLLVFDRLPRHQDLRTRARWLADAGAPPLMLLFISHRWETPEHPDPRGRQLAAIRALVRHIAATARAMTAERSERLRRVPSLEREGVLQAEAIVRRALGHDPLGDALRICDGPTVQRELLSACQRFAGDEAAFEAWLASRIGLWVDYSCMPQRPFAGNEEAEFRQALRDLDGLVGSSTLVALREGGDDYPTRGWCALEFFLASARSFARGLFVDTGRLLTGEPVVTPAPPLAGAASSFTAQVMQETYASDLAAWQHELGRWVSDAGSFVTGHSPNAWGCYRSLQGSAFFDSNSDPNPFRRVLDVVMRLETALVGGWLMSERERQVDLGAVIQAHVEAVGLHCAHRADLHYLGFTMACSGWLEVLRPLGQACRRRHLDTMELAHPSAEAPWPTMAVTLHPVSQELRALFKSVAPSSPAVWYSRLRESTEQVGSHDRTVVERVKQALALSPPRFEVFEEGARPGVELERAL